MKRKNIGLFLNWEMKLYLNISTVKKISIFSFLLICLWPAFCGRKLGSVLIQESCVEQQHRKRYVLKHLSYDRTQVRNKINNVEREVVLQYIEHMLVRLRGLKIIPDILHKSGDILNNWVTLKFSYEIFVTKLWINGALLTESLVFLLRSF